MTKRLECPLCGGELQCEGTADVILRPRVWEGMLVFETDDITDHNFDFLYCQDCFTTFNKHESWEILRKAFPGVAVGEE